MNQFWSLTIVIGGILSLAFGYLGYTMRVLHKEVKAFANEFNKFQIKYANEQGEKMTFVACGEMQSKCAADVKGRIEDVCNIAKHHKHTDNGLVILP